MGAGAQGEWGRSGEVCGGCRVAARVHQFWAGLGAAGRLGVRRAALGCWDRAKRARPRPGRSRRCFARRARSQLGPDLLAGGELGVSASKGTAKEIWMTLKICAAVLELMRELAPLLPALRARSTALCDPRSRPFLSPRRTVRTRAVELARRVIGRLLPLRANRSRAGRLPKLSAGSDRSRGSCGVVHGLIGTLVRLVEPKR